MRGGGGGGATLHEVASGEGLDASNLSLVCGLDYHRGSSGEDGLRSLRNIVGLVLLLALAVREVPVAAPQDGGVLGLSHRGPGAQIRARIDRVHRLAETAPDEAAALGDELLLDLQDQRGLDGPLTEETRDVLARELIGVRAQLAVAEIGRAHV